MAETSQIQNTVTYRAKKFKELQIGSKQRDSHLDTKRKYWKQQEKRDISFKGTKISPS